MALDKQGAKVVVMILGIFGGHPWSTLQQKRHVSTLFKQEMLNKNANWIFV